MTESEKKIKSLLMKVKENSEQADLKLNIQKTKIIASSSITSWQNVGKEWKLSDFIFLGSKITEDGECSDTIKMLAPWKKSYGKPRQRIKKQRHYFVDKVHLVKAMVFQQSCIDVRVGP